MTAPTLPRDSDGRLSHHAWPGGYPIYYVTHDAGTLCPACANGDNGSEAYTVPNGPADPTIEEAQWLIIGADVHYEGAPLTCDHCAATIESAYGDPDAPEEAPTP